MKRIPRVVEAKETFEKETLIDPVSSDEDFYLEHLNRSLHVDSCPGIKKNEFSMDENPNLVAIATYEQSKTTEKVRIMRSSSEQSSLRHSLHKRGKARLGYHSMSQSPLTLKDNPRLIKTASKGKNKMESIEFSPLLNVKQ